MPAQPHAEQIIPDAIANPMQPFINIVQANVPLLSKYAVSPDTMLNAMAQLQAAMTQGPGVLSAPQSANALQSWFKA